VIIEKIMDEKGMRKSKGKSHNRVGSWSFLFFEVSGGWIGCVL
jgi:hypothetical protein